MEFEILGDPHLGRRFKTGVPLHRVGEREEMVWLQFRHALQVNKAPLHICMGDLFDRFVVPPEIVLQAASAYITAARAQPDTTFVIIEGNHDVSRDTSKASSFDLFVHLVSHMENIHVVTSEAEVLFDTMGFVPYNPFRSAAEMVAELPDDLEVVFGHFDVQDWGGDNVIPTQLLAEKGITKAITGHDHLARTEKRHGVEILVTGSMQPYTHAEDNTGQWYVTVTLDELAEMDVTNKNVRLLLREGEEIPTDLDCLSLIVRRVVDDDEKIEVDTSEFESLDLAGLLASSLEGLSVKDEIMEMFRAT